MKISILIPGHNEEKSIARCLDSCLNQSRPLDEIVVVNDGSTDRTGEILATYGDKIKVVNKEAMPGSNKSYAQEYGLPHVTGDVMITTDADTILDRDFVKYIEESFVRNPDAKAVSGYVRSMRHNWLTLCRAFEYSLGQNLHKLSQHHFDFLFVIPGAAGAFDTQTFKDYLTFEHDVITEDLDFTYRLHQGDFKIVYDRRAVVYTEDPATFHSYINQVRRWFSGGWQCLAKHWRLALTQPKIAFGLSLIYTEAVLFSVLLFILPLLSIKTFLTLMLWYLVLTHILAAVAAWKERRLALLLSPVPYLLLTYVHIYVLFEQFIKELVLKKKTLSWFHPERKQMTEQILGN